MTVQNTKLSGYNPNRHPSSIPSYLGLPRISGWKKFANLLGPDTPNKLKCDCFCTGRSMVEMLGVLAIIGVLSVGAIAGYSKAMTKYKLNKQVQDYNYLFAQLKMLHSGFHNLPSYTSVEPQLKKLKIIEDTKDVFGNDFSIRYDPTFYIFDIYLSSSKLSNDKLQNCQNLLSNLLIPNYDGLQFIQLVTGVGGSTEQPSQVKYQYYGNTFCSDSSQCLQNMSLTQISSFCDACESEKLCRIEVFFK